MAIAGEASARRCRLYLITPPRIEPERFAGVLAEALTGGDVACVQLRLPGADTGALRRAAEALMPACHAEGVAFVVDRDAAVAAETDGVHLADAGAVAAARRALGPAAIVGASCGGSRDAAITASEAGADYVSFGAFHPSPTVPEADIVSPDIVSWWSEIMEIPCVAVGGITAANCAPLVRAGADFVAVSSAVWDHPAGPAAAVSALDLAVERAPAS